MLLAGLADRAAEELVGPYHRAALLALDEECRGEPGTARRTEVPDLATTTGALTRNLGFELDEVPQGEATPNAERHPVAKRLATLLLDPVSSGPLTLLHRRSVDDTDRQPPGEAVE